MTRSSAIQAREEQVSVLQHAGRTSDATRDGLEKPIAHRGTQAVACGDAAEFGAAAHVRLRTGLCAGQFAGPAVAVPGRFCRAVQEESGGVPVAGGVGSAG